MKQAMALLATVIGALALGGSAFGDGVVLLVIAGAMALMALMIAATFLWLWFERTTPLALGMVFSWAGAAAYIGWWWVTALTETAGLAWQHGVGLLVQGLFLVGAVLHFAVIHRSFGLQGVAFLWPVGLAFAISSLAILLV